MLNQLRIQVRGGISERFLDESLEYVFEDLRKSRNRMDQDICDIISRNRMDNEDADDFFQVAADILAYGDLSAHNDGIDLTRDRETYDKLLSNALHFAVAIFVCTDRALADSLDRSTYDKFRDMDDTYRKKILPVIQREGRRDFGRRDSGRRDDYYDDRRGGRDIRDSGRRDTRSMYDTAYQAPRRDDRRELRDSRDDGTTTAYGAGMLSKMRQEEEPRQRRDEPYAGMDVLAREDRVSNPAPETRFGTARPMENYEAHELRALQTPTRERDSIVVPLVDFTRTPELAVKEVVESNPDIKELPDVVNIVTECEFPHSAAIADKLIGKQEITVYRAQQYRLRTMPLILAPAFEGVESYRSFDQWYKALNSAMAIVTNMPPEDEIYKSIAVSFIQSVNYDITQLFNTIMAIVDDLGAKVNSFVDHAGEAFNWLRSAEGADVYRLFQELEPEFIRHNYAILTDEEVSKVNQVGSILGPVGTIENVKHCWVASRILNVHYAGSILGKSLTLQPGKISNVEYDMVPDFYNACARIVRLRNTRKTMSMILLSDSLGHRVSILAGKREGGVIRVKSFNN